MRLLRAVATEEKDKERVEVGKDDNSENMEEEISEESGLSEGPASRCGFSLFVVSFSFFLIISPRLLYDLSVFVRVWSISDFFSF